MLHITSINLLTILKLYSGRTDFQTYLGSAIAKKTADPRLVPDFSVSW